MIAFGKSTPVIGKKVLVIHPRALKQRVIDVLVGNHSNSWHTSFENIHINLIFLNRRTPSSFSEKGSV